jgi:hypothetical protein
VEGSGRGLTRGAFLEFEWRNWVKPRKPSVRLVGDPAEIRTRHLLSTCQKHYYLSKLGRLKLCCLVGKYQRLEETCCLHLQGNLKVKAAGSSKTHDDYKAKNQITFYKDIAVLLCLRHSLELHTMKHPILWNLGWAGQASKHGMLGRGLGESFAKPEAAESWRNEHKEWR